MKLLIVFILQMAAVSSLSLNRHIRSTMTETASSSTSSSFTRAQFFSIATVTATTAIAASVTAVPSVANALDTIAKKQTNLSDSDLETIIMGDLLDRKFMESGDLTRSVYDESAKFTDEIDTYGLEPWMKGTKKLFVPEGSTFHLAGDVINVSKEKVEFRFEEDLMFRIPFRPVVSLTGRVVLERDGSTGLITSYREFWDQSVLTVLKSAKFGK